MSKLSKRHRVRSAQGEARPFAGMRQVTSTAAGVDIGAQEIVACVPDGADQQIGRTFGTYTADLQTLADWLVDRGIETVAMESTGVYWLPLLPDQRSVHSTRPRTQERCPRLSVAPDLAQRRLIVRLVAP